MNETIKSQLNHRTIRKFTDQKIDPDTLKTLLEVANMGPSSSGMQKCSIIRVTDQGEKEAFAKIGKQDYMADATELFIFIIDCHRNYQIASEEKEENQEMKGFDKFFEGLCDCIIASQNLVVAAESLGLGTNYFGNINNDPQQVIDLLKLPKLTYPAIGLGIGYPGQSPQLKPRLPLEAKVFENTYQDFSSYHDLLKDYDEIMKTYYDLRDTNKKTETFTSSVINKEAHKTPLGKGMYQALLAQGFLPDI